MRKLIERSVNGVHAGGVEESSVLDAAFYTSVELFEVEKSALLHPSWHMVCRVEDIERPGSYFCDEYLDRKFFVLHGYDGTIRTFANVCLHRRSTLLEGAGELACGRRRIVCPYHRWCYDDKGRLTGGPGANVEKKCDEARTGLQSIRTHIWNGFVFITLSNETAAFDAYIGDYHDLVKPYHHHLRCVRKTQYEIAANWKGYVEVDMETCHTPSVHPGSIGNQSVMPVVPRGQYIGVWHDSAYTVALRPDERQFALPRIVDPFGKHPDRTCFCVILPSLFIVNTVDSMWWIHKVPLSVDRTLVRCGFAFPEETIARPDFEEIAPRYFSRWDAVIEEDNWIVERQFRGIRSGGDHGPGCYTRGEEVVLEFNRWVVSRMADYLDIGRRDAATA